MFEQFEEFFASTKQQLLSLISLDTIAELVKSAISSTVNLIDDELPDEVVRALQLLLNYAVDSLLISDGRAGPLTQAALHRAQMRFGYAPTDAVEPAFVEQLVAHAKELAPKGKAKK